HPPTAPAQPGPCHRPEAPTLVAVAHGSRDPAARRTVTALLDVVRAQRPGLRVRLGHLELDEPLLGDTLAALPPGEVVLVPLLFGRGYHTRHDIPAVARAARGHHCQLAAPLGPDPLLAEALADRLAAAGARDPDGVVLAAAGSRDPRSAADAEATARLLSARLGGVPVLPGYAGAAEPGIPGALDRLAALGCRRPAVASYFTAPGHFATRCARAAAPHPVSAPLGDHPALARLVLHRYDQAHSRALARG
ncbi:sirohydrochlorin chelatase, partial [Streptomyces alkaliterrae]